MKTYYLAAAVCLTLVGCSSTSNITETLIQPDPAWTSGQLENGLTYHVYPDHEESVSVRLVVHAGSFQETDQQEGYAHFLEHMAFNGSKNFSQNDVIRLFEDAGSSFGADINAYTSYEYLNNFQSIEAIAVEREFHGIPVGRIPAEYLSPNATEDQVAVRVQMEKILKDLKLNAQGYALLPSDLLLDNEGKSTGGVAARLVDIELISSQGNRNIHINPIVQRYQHDIARSVLSEFLMLGSDSSGSYALSKSKTDLFLRALESYINTVADVLNKQLVERLWDLNGFPVETMPKIVAGDVAPHELKELGSYLRNLNGANIDLSDEPDVVNELLSIAELPTIDPARIEQKAKDKKALEQQKAKPQEVMPVGANKEKEE